MTFIEWLSENQGWFLMYLFMGIFIASIFFDKFPGIPTLSYNNTNTLFASMWLLGWLMMAVAVVTGGIWVLIVLPLWKIALGALGIAVLLLVLTFVGIAAKAWHDKHTIF